MAFQRLECLKCNATGKLDAFKHIKNGVCFTCEGSGYVWRVPQEETPKEPVKPASKAKFITVNGEQSQVIPYGQMLQITGDTGCVWIDWEAAKRGIIKLEGISDGWKRFKPAVIRDIKAQIKPIR